MTVEQTPLPVRPGQRPRDENLTLTFAKVREVTGAPDHIIEEAIRACRRTDGTIKVEDVVTTIITDDSVTAGKAKNRTSQRIPSKSSDQIDAIPGGEQVASTSNPPGKKTATTSASASSTSKPAIAFNEEYIDLTRDPQGILGGQVSREEQDISRVLEASLAESKGNSKRKRGELWFVDPLNPYERKRQDAWPVGLKNVGNTCWFSAVIQSLFHIRKFRDIVLNFKPKSSITNESSPNLRFVSELRQLFALLVASKKKYVDPSRAVDILKENSSTTTVLDGQQDVSEFQHKLLDWLEDAFQVPAQEKGVEKPPLEKNPVNQLFQGKYKAEGFHQGTVFSQEVTFGQYPLNVIGFSDIHESLEATTAQGEIETVGGDPTQKSGQEIWFTHLPVVLTFELSRFGFNQQLNRPEKIHQHLSFPPVIYVDRYLECNKSVTRQKREEARKLKEELASLQDKLDKFMNYGSSSKRYPLPDVLQYALEFAQSSPAHRPHNPLSHPVVVSAAPVTQPCTAASSSQDVEMKSPVPSSRDCNKSTVVSSCDVSMTSIGETPPRVGEQSLSSSAATAITTTTPLGATKPSSTPIPVTHLASAAGKAEKNTHLSTSPASLSSAAPEAKKFKDSSVQADYSSIVLPSSCSSSSSSTLPTSGGFQASSSSSLSSPSSSHLDQAGSHLSERVPSPMHLEPHPKTVTEDELRVLQDCLRRWRQEVEMDVRELQTNISALKGKLDRMYSEDNMKKFPYHLHAVLVHEGQAVSGHYWAFIQDPQSGKWLKFNDITASESSFEEMHKESVGGFHNASAYCLMYVDRSRLEEAHGRDQSNSATETDLLSTLPPDLQQVVEEDNHLFTMEMLSWDEEQKRKVMEKSAGASAATVSVAGTSGQSGSASVSTMTSPPASSSSGQMQPEWIASSPRPRSHSDDQDVVVTGEQRPGETGIIQPLNSSMSNMAKQHAQLSLQATLTAVTQAISAAEGPVSPQEVMKRSLDRELQRLRSDKKQLPGYLPLKDPRLDHMVLYLLSAEADMNTIRLVLSEQFSMCVLLDSASRVKGVRLVAHEMYSQFYKQSTNESVQHYKFWHRRYHHFRQAMYMFTAGVEAYCAGRYHEALPYFNQAWLHNQEPGLSGLPKQMMKHGGIDPALLAQCRRNCLQKLNAATLQQFESPLEGDMTDALTTMSNLILPSLGQLAQSQFQEDTLAVEQLRSDWCQLLEKELTGDKIERLEDFLSKMFDGSGNQASESPKTVRDNDLMSPLSDQYRHAMELFKGTGELDAWLGAS